MVPNTEAVDITAAPAESVALTPIAGAKSKSALIAYGEQGVALKTMEDAFLFAKAVIDSGMAPKGFSTPQAILVAIQFGAELGLSPMASLSNVAIINGRPTFYGDAVPGVCADLVESYKDEMTGDGDARACKVTVTRKGRTDPIVRTFSIADAKKAGLWGKPGPWSQYPERMLLMRARTFAYRDAFPDRLKGMRTLEETRDHPEPRNVTNSSLDDLEKKDAA